MVYWLLTHQLYQRDLCFVGTTRYFFTSKYIALTEYMKVMLAQGTSPGYNALHYTLF